MYAPYRRVNAIVLTDVQFTNDRIVIKVALGSVKTIASHSKNTKWLSNQ